MSKLMNKITILGVSVAMLATSMMPAQAAMPLVAAPQVEKQVVDVQYRERWERGDRWDRRDRWERRYERRHDRYDRRHSRRDNSWVPLAAGALIAGAVIAGSAAAQPRYVAPPAYRAPTRAGLNPRHYEYCAGRYRSYDSYSNTFQPYHGPRQQCYSPYY